MTPKGVISDTLIIFFRRSWLIFAETLGGHSQLDKILPEWFLMVFKAF